MEKSQCEVEAFKLFAFGIGELVCSQQDVANAGSGKGWIGATTKLKVVARDLFEDCTGSVQRLYSVRAFLNQSASTLIQFQELELCRPPEVAVDS